MKPFFRLFIAAFFLMQGISFAADTSDSTTEVQSQPHSKVPDFSPPKNLTGPVFPPEEFIEPPNEDTNRFLREFINMMATLGLIISLILIVAWFLKRMLNTRQEQANATSIIKIVERRSLSPKTAVYLLEIEGKTLVISESHNGVTRLADYDTPEDKEETKPLPSAFNQILDKNKS